MCFIVTQFLPYYKRKCACSTKSGADFCVRSCAGPCVQPLISSPFSEVRTK
ncbi:hypothetical protein BACCAP_01570 [Pseudoflavonifractor capillosus ATCC 29799]|uniref:Uncharacterized protein n=1 Tax=Pseudoflavonifractor capillosus ATCC 29799 TaxID=411467 RepID=A6NTP1_9FIRM|nr:hypothetical protein BACCAP_01570 [Pseudoflavonifractor capillosus ATCC 29799]